MFCFLWRHSKIIIILRTIFFFLSYEPFILRSNFLAYTQYLSFIVDNNHDRRILNGMLEKYQMAQWITIVTSKFLDSMHDISEGKCQSNYSTILDLLEIENPNVANCLIDQKKVEKIILIDTDTEAQNLLTYQQKVPKYCKYAWAINRGEYNQFFPAPNYKSYAPYLPGIKKSVKNIMTISMVEHIAAIESEIKSIDMNVKNQNKDLNEMNAGLVQHQNEINSAKKTCSELSKKVQELHKEIWKLEQKNISEKPIDLSAMEEDRERWQEKLAEVEIDINETNEKITAVTELLNQNNSNLKNKEDEICAHTEKFGPLDEKLKKIDRKIDSLRIQRQHAETKYKDLNERKESYQQKHGYKKQKLADQNETMKREWNGVSGID